MSVNEMPSAGFKADLNEVDAPEAAHVYCTTLLRSGSLTYQHVPENASIDWKLVTGAALFGLGWGLVGLCPGPAIAALSTGRWEAAVFVAAMVLGMAAYRVSLGGTLKTSPSANTRA
ncbi:DUF6691 family protein [Ensifer sp. 4252]|uniref:DUF6691 family protein n=1 Tax=Ensifer sp. 4252 TaxID=3373915 RepID=UPI003D1F049F